MKYGKIKLSYSKLSDNSKSFYKDQVYLFFHTLRINSAKYFYPFPTQNSA